MTVSFRLCYKNRTDIRVGAWAILNNDGLFPLVAEMWQSLARAAAALSVSTAMPRIRVKPNLQLQRSILFFPWQNGATAFKNYARGQGGPSTQVS